MGNHVTAQTCLLYYCCLYDPRGKARAFQGQKNLSAHVLAVLEKTYPTTMRVLDRDSSAVVPKVFDLLKTARRIEAYRARATTPNSALQGVTVVDMVLSFADLPSERFLDNIVLIGHDSYALRAWREWRQTPLGRGWLRRGLAWWAWHRLERHLARICAHRIYVSPVDQRVAGPLETSSVISIPLGSDIHAAKCSTLARPKQHPPRTILIPVPVLNAAQNAFEARALVRILEVLPQGAVLTLWGAAASHHAKAFGTRPNLRFVDWVEDYTAFLSGFDLLLYPRAVGSGFHTKLAEAQALGVPCLTVDWVAAALQTAGYTGLSTYRGGAFIAALSKVLADGAPHPGAVPRTADPDVALRPLLDAIVGLGAPKERQ